MNKKSFWFKISLRLSLFRIWFMKNILVWLQIFGITCIIMMLTGNITASTPILGKIIYPLFKPLVDEIVSVINEREITGLMDFFGIAISLLTSVGIFMMKARSIAQTDIKKDKTKIALIQAGLYFNEDGKLTKKVEKMTNTDLDGDGKADNNEGKPTQGFFSGMFTAVKEFMLIAKADFSDDEEKNKKVYKETLNSAGLENTESALKELGSDTKNAAEVLVLDTAIDATSNAILKVQKKKKKKSSEEEELDKIYKESLLKKIREWFINMKNKKKKEIKHEKDIEIIENNAEKDGETKEVKKEKKNKETVIVEKPAVVETTPTDSTDAAIANFLNQMR